MRAPRSGRAGRERHDVVDRAGAGGRSRWCSSTPRRCCAVEGVLVDWRGSRDPRGRADGRGAAAELLGLERSAVVAVAPYPQARDLHLHVFAKRAEPRPSASRAAPGIARKRPLGA